MEETKNNCEACGADLNLAHGYFSPIVLAGPEINFCDERCCMQWIIWTPNERAEWLAARILLRLRAMRRSEQ